MAINGQSGKKVSDSVRDRACNLLAEGLSVPLIAIRLGVSKSLVRNWQRELWSAGAIDKPKPVEASIPVRPSMRKLRAWVREQLA